MPNIFTKLLNNTRSSFSCYGAPASQKSRKISSQFNQVFNREIKIEHCTFKASRAKGGSVNSTLVCIGVNNSNQNTHLKPGYHALESYSGGGEKISGASIFSAHQATPEPKTYFATIKRNQGAFKANQKAQACSVLKVVLPEKSGALHHATRESEVQPELQDHTVPLQARSIVKMPGQNSATAENLAKKQVRFTLPDE